TSAYSVGLHKVVNSLAVVIDAELQRVPRKHLRKIHRQRVRVTNVVLETTSESYAERRIVLGVNPWQNWGLKERWRESNCGRVCRSQRCRVQPFVPAAIACKRVNYPGWARSNRVV